MSAKTFADQPLPGVDPAPTPDDQADQERRNDQRAKAFKRYFDRTQADAIKFAMRPGSPVNKVYTMPDSNSRDYALMCEALAQAFQDGWTAAVQADVMIPPVQ